MNGYHEGLLAALGRFAPGISETEAAALVPLLLTEDSNGPIMQNQPHLGLLNVLVDAFRLGAAAARGERQEDDLIAEALDLPEPPDEPVPVRVGTRMVSKPGTPAVFQVMLDLDGHTFASSALFSADVGAERARVETAMALRRPLAVTEQEPFRHQQPRDVDA